MAEPFISPLGLTIWRNYCQRLFHCSCGTVLLGFLCGANRRGCTYDTSVVLEVQEDTVGALPGLGLADDDGGVNLLSELGLSLLDGSHAVQRAMSVRCAVLSFKFMMASVWAWSDRV